MPWYEILGVSVGAWLIGSILLAVGLGRVLRALRRTGAPRIRNL